MSIPLHLLHCVLDHVVVEAIKSMSLLPQNFEPYMTNTWARTTLLQW